MCVLVPFCLHKYETVSKSNRSNSKFSERREPCRNFFFETEQSWINLAPFTYPKLNSWLNGFSMSALSLSEYAFCTEFSLNLRSLRQFNSSALPRWGVICHRDSRDQPQPGSFLWNKREDPGNEVDLSTGMQANSWFSRYVTAAMLVDINKRFLQNFFCLFHQHGYHAFANWISGDWLQTINIRYGQSNEITIFWIDEIAKINWPWLYAFRKIARLIVSRKFHVIR